MKMTKNLRICVFAIALAAVAAVALAGCASSQSSSASSGSSSSASSSADSSTSSSGQIEVLDGNLAATVSLDYSAGTGYMWECKFVEESPACSITEERDVSKSSDDRLAGGPMVHEVDVWAREPGTATLECKLLRPWEEGDPAEVQTYVFEVDGTGQLHFDEAHSSFENPPEFMTLS